MSQSWFCQLWVIRITMSIIIIISLYIHLNEKNISILTYHWSHVVATGTSSQTLAPGPSTSSCGLYPTLKDNSLYAWMSFHYVPSRSLYFYFIFCVLAKFISQRSAWTCYLSKYAFILLNVQSILRKIRRTYLAKYNTCKALTSKRKAAVCRKIPIIGLVSLGGAICWAIASPSATSSWGGALSTWLVGGDWGLDWTLIDDCVGGFEMFVDWGAPPVLEGTSCNDGVGCTSLGVSATAELVSSTTNKCKHLLI